MFVNNENAAWRRTDERSDCQLCEIYNKQYITNKFYFERNIIFLLTKKFVTVYTCYGGVSFANTQNLSNKAIKHKLAIKTFKY